MLISNEWKKFQVYLRNNRCADEESTCSILQETKRIGLTYHRLGHAYFKWAVYRWCCIMHHGTITLVLEMLHHFVETELKIQ